MLAAQTWQGRCMQVLVLHAGKKTVDPSLAHLLSLFYAWEG